MFIKNIIIPAITAPYVAKILTFRSRFFEIIRNAENKTNNRRLSGLARIDIIISRKKIYVLFLNNMKRAINTIIADRALGPASDAAFNRKGLIDRSNAMKNAG